jgi:hypothetical protein
MKMESCWNRTSKRLLTTQGSWGTFEADTSVMRDARGKIIGHDQNPLSALLSR